MNRTERAAINRQNSLKSTGPKTAEGKEKASRNSTKHGLTAARILLPHENPEEMKFRAEAWLEACAPATQDEHDLVNQCAYATMQLERFAKAENQIITEQVNNAEAAWDIEHEAKLQANVRLFEKDPHLGIIQLRHTSMGVRWLIDRWNDVQYALEKHNCLNSVALITEALKLFGYNPFDLNKEDLCAYQFAFMAVHSVPNHEKNPAFAEYLESQTTARWVACFGARCKANPEQALELVKNRIASEIEDLNGRAERLDAIATASRAGAKTRAMAPADTAENRLLLRYLRTTELGFDRSLKTLMKLQAERQKAHEKEAREQARSGRGGGLRNEAKGSANTNANPLSKGSCADPREPEKRSGGLDASREVLATLDPKHATMISEFEPPQKAAV